MFLFKLLNGYFELDFTNFFTLSHNSHTRGHPFKLLKPPAYHLCRINFFGTRVINDWNYLTSDIVTNSSLNSFKSAVDYYSYDSSIINVFNVIIISIDNFICALLYAIERVYRLLSLNPEYNHNHNHNH